MSHLLKQMPKVFSVATRKSILRDPSKSGLRERHYTRKVGEDINKYLKITFVEADKDKDGQVSAEELKQAVKMSFMSKKKPESPTVNAFFEKVLFQNKPTLSQEELLGRANQLVVLFMALTEELLRIKFLHFDTDKDGKLSKEETGKLLEELYPFIAKDRLDYLMKNYDKDKDGKINLEDLLEFAKKELCVVKHP